LQASLGGTPADGLQYAAKPLHAMAWGCAMLFDLGMRKRDSRASASVRSSVGSSACNAFD